MKFKVEPTRDSVLFVWIGLPNFKHVLPLSEKESKKDNLLNQKGFNVSTSIENPPNII